MSSKKNTTFYDKELIKIVVNNPCLYDKRIQGKFPQHVLNMMWQEIESVFQQRGIQIANPEKRWTQLRSNFIRNYTKGNIQWHLYKDMSFLIGHFNTRKVSNKENESSNAIQFSNRLGAVKLGGSSQSVNYLQPHSAANTSLVELPSTPTESQPFVMNTSNQLDMLLTSTSEGDASLNTTKMEYEVLAYEDEIIEIHDDDETLTTTNIPTDIRRCTPSPFMDNLDLILLGPSRDFCGTTQSLPSSNSLPVPETLKEAFCNNVIISEAQQCTQLQNPDHSLPEVDKLENISFPHSKSPSSEKRLSTQTHMITTEAEIHAYVHRPNLRLTQIDVPSCDSLNISHSPCNLKAPTRKHIHTTQPEITAQMENLDLILPAPLRELCGPVNSLPSSNSHPVPETMKEASCNNSSSAEYQWTNESSLSIDSRSTSSRSYSCASTHNHSNGAVKQSAKKVNPFTSYPVSGKFLRVSEVNQRKRTKNIQLNGLPLKKSLVVPPMDKFAKDKRGKQRNSTKSSIQQAVLQSAKNLHQVTNHFTTLMQLKAELLKQQLLEKKDKSQDEVQLVQGDSLFNLFRSEWLQLSTERQTELSSEALDIMESCENLQ